MRTFQRLVVALCVTILATTSVSAKARPRGHPAVHQENTAVYQENTPVHQIENFYDALLGVMKQGPQLGVEGRFKKLAPQVDSTFDLAAMTKFTVGPSWDTMSEADHKALIEAFRRMTIADYAHNFASFNGQKFVVDSTVEERNIDRLVHSQLIPVDDKPVSFTYRMRQSGGTWKVIDIFLEGYVSELATRRSDFAATVQSGGATGLVQKLNELSDKFMKGEN